jgi:probable rRNA maturation factor
VTVYLLNQQSQRLPQKWLEQVARKVMQAEGCHPETELSIVIGDDAWIQELNRTYLKKNRPTDVIAFPQDAGPAGRPLLGDVAISAETAALQAAAHGHSLRRELALLLAHGILHLTGWDDKTTTQRQRMMSRVEELLETLPPS